MNTHSLLDISEFITSYSVNGMAVFVLGVRKGNAFGVPEFGLNQQLAQFEADFDELASLVFLK